MTGKWIVGVGAALVDLLIEENDAFLNNLQAEKGGMTLVDLTKIESILKNSKSELRIVPGGSACNTLVGIGHLGGQAHMQGRLGRDDLAVKFTNGLKKAGVKYSAIQSSTPTGRVLSVVTPDAQRTMFTYLGAAAELSPEDLDSDSLLQASLIHLEGYLLFNQPVVQKILALKQQSKALLALDLASFEVVAACRDFIDTILAQHIDIVIANEDEAKAYTGLEGKAALKKLSGVAEIAIVKLGKKGALISRGGEITEVKAETVTALDTTGAGDLWAAGFFYGLTHDYSMEKCGQLAARVAAEVVQVMGASIDATGWARIKAFKQELES